MRLLAVLLLAVGASAQTPVCELAVDPARFSGKEVRVRVPVTVGFEAFLIGLADCSDRKVDAIWLRYGKGPKRQPTTWCCGDLTPRGPYVLRQDAAFRKLHSALTSRYPGTDRPRYFATATITGRFTFLPPASCANGGFGHFGLSCAGIVITSVADVAIAPAAAK